jgi:hypothetical protein
VALPAVLLAHLLNPRPDEWFDLVVTFAMPDGTFKRMARAPYGLECEGSYSYPGLVTEFDVFEVACDFGTFSMDTGSKKLSFTDTDEWFSSLDAVGEPLAGIVVTTQLAGKYVPVGDWFTLHQGTINPKWSVTPGGECSVTLDSSSAWLDTPMGHAVTEANFPDAPASSIGKLAPTVLGIWDACTGGGAGAVTLVPLSSDGTVWGTFGWLYSIERVFAEKTPKLPATYTLSHPKVNAEQWTILTFSPPLSPVTAVVTIDCSGYESVGDGTGSMIYDPMAQLVWRLANLCWAQTNALWADGSAAPIDLASAALVTARHATLCVGGPYRGTRLIAGDSMDSAPTGRQELESFCKQFHAAGFFDYDGKVHFVVENAHETAYVATEPIVESDVDDYSFEKADWRSCRRVDVQYGAQAGGQTVTLSILDPSGDMPGTETLSLDLVPSGAR